MADFFTVELIEKRTAKEFGLTIGVEFLVNHRTRDLMVRGGDFYAVWDEDAGMWSKSIQTVIDIVDGSLDEARKNLERPERYDRITVLYMKRSSSGTMQKFNTLVQKLMRDNFKPLDEKLVYQNTKVKKTDYVSMRQPFNLEEGAISAYEELFTQLYDPENLEKLEWCVGACVKGDSKRIEKCAVLYGAPGTGKGTYLNNIVQRIFEGHTSAFNAKRMSSLSNSFALDSFKDGPLVSIQPDGDLSRIEDNTLLNSVISHEILEVNPKYGRMYTSKFNTFLYLGTNKPVKITDSKSGLLRRIIDIHPTGNKVPPKRYRELKNQLQFEIGAIAYHCLKVYERLGEDYYDGYIPLEMMEQTNDFFDFMQTCYDDFVSTDHVTLTEAWKRYKEYCEFAGAYQLPMRAIRVELGNYFRTYEERSVLNGVRVRSLYSGFRTDRFVSRKEERKDADRDTGPEWLRFNCKSSLFDETYTDWPAQYEVDYGKGPQPEVTWSKCKTTLGDILTTKTHYTKPPKDYPIVMVDFDLRDENGEKSLKLNLEAASSWLPTYGELSKSGGGIHLYYLYDGDISKLSRVYAPGIEVKVFTGNSAIRRRLSFCNKLTIAVMPIGGLPLKGEKKKVINWDGIKNEKMLRAMIKKNLNKEYHGDTTSSIDYIKKLLDDAYESGMGYDVEDMHDAVLIFAMGSTNQSERCINTVSKMKWKSESSSNAVTAEEGTPLIFLDTEIYRPDEETNNPGLFLVCWKYFGAPADSVVALENPSPEEIEQLFHFDIAGYNCRDYDNHMLYAASLGKSNAALYDLSYRIVNLNDASAKYGEAYNISKWDVYEYCKAAGKRQSLKAWEIELGLSHMEMGIPWDQPAPIEMWPAIVEYCKNDVLATEAVFVKTEGYRLAREFQVALVKALHGDDIPVTTNDTANTLTKRAIFGKERHPQGQFNYRNLALPVGSDQYEYYLNHFGPDYRFRVWNEYGLPEYRDYIPGEVLPDGWSILPFFPGYEFDQYAPKDKKSSFHGDFGGEGGRTFSSEGIWVNVLDLDITSQYPFSMRMEVLLGPVYQKILDELVDARVAVKHRDFETAGSLLQGALKPFLSEDTAGDLAQGLKIIINAVYGLTAAGFENEFRDPRNVDNIVAKRGNLFMLVLKEQIELKGYKVVHIKTDSIKIANADDYIHQWVVDFGHEYGYDFEVEGRFKKFALLNDAAYVALDEDGNWITKAKQFQEPYVKKSLFTREPITFDDICQTFNVKAGSLYLDMNEGLEDVSEIESRLEKLQKALCNGKLPKGFSSEYELTREIESLKGDIPSGHNMQFVGRVGRFCPIKPGCGGGILYRVQDGKNYAASGTTGYRWLEAEYVKKYGLEDSIDMSYFTRLVDEAADAIAEVGDENHELDWFLSEDTGDILPDFINIPEGVDEEVPFDTGA